MCFTIFTKILHFAKPAAHMWYKRYICIDECTSSLIYCTGWEGGERVCVSKNYKK